MQAELNVVVPPLLDSAPLSQLNKDAKAVGRKMENGPVQVMKSSSTFGVLVSAEAWNEIAQAMAQIEDMREIIELQRLEIDRLKKGRPESTPADIEMLERMAGRARA